MLFKVTLTYFNVLYLKNSPTPTISGEGYINCNDPHFRADFRISKQTFGKSFKLEITKATIFGPDATHHAQNREMALDIKRRIRIQMIAMIKEKLEGITI